MTKYMDDYEQTDEILKLQREVKAISSHVKDEQLARWVEAQDSRKLPPLNGLTRMQKRYFLEPWMTTLAVVNGVLAFVWYTIGIVMWNRLAWIGVLFTVLTMVCVALKVFYMEQNERTDGRLQN